MEKAKKRIKLIKTDKQKVKEWYDDVEEFIKEGQTWTQVCIGYIQYDNVPTIWFQGCIVNGELYEYLKHLYLNIEFY